MAENPTSPQTTCSCACTPVDSELRRTLVNTTTAFGLAGAVCAALPFLKALSPNKAVKAQATLDIKLAEIPLGQSKTYLWQGKPVFVWHRTPEQIAAAQKGDATATMDPAKDADRVKKPEWLVVMGICTHLGCVPLQGGEFGGWRCPCHGSQYDDSGRVRHGPAGTNLEVPPYAFLDDETLRIG